MSTVLQPVIVERDQNNTSFSKLRKDFFSNKNSKYGIKCKENIFKHKFSKNKALKNKLKKYKLRRDGKEDPDVLNVSHIFQSSLKIKSPNNNYIEELNFCDSEVYPRNYLSKMVRRKRLSDKNTSLKTLFKETPKNNILVDEITLLDDKTEQVDLLTPDAQDVKQTNVFQLMMEARNKSIGGNSPGKEKTVDEAELKLLNEKKSNKAKRLLVLEKMAEAKGSLKKREKEAMAEEAIKKKMDKRAERLTNMLVNNRNIKNKARKENTELIERKKNNKKSPTPCKKEVIEEPDVDQHGPGTLQLINMFDEPVCNGTGIKSLCVKQISKEDTEFLKKLSPSIKKKENMLCYFKKLDKDEEPLVSSNSESTALSSPIIKVKFSTRNKNKSKKKKLSLKLEEKQNENEDIEIVIQDQTISTNHLNTDTNSNIDSRKRKREQIVHVKDTQVPQSPEISIESVEINENNLGRPKRNTKRPIQYTDFDLSSSEEEYNIFTTKKKKVTDKKLDALQCSKLSTPSNKEKSVKNDPKDVKKPLKKLDVNEKSNIKLAPIFAPKPQIDPAALEAKQKFLQSGVPDKLKKIATQRAKIENEINYFPAVVHVQQEEIQDNFLSKNTFVRYLKCDSDAECSPVKCEKNLFKNILSPERPGKHKVMPKVDINAREVLKDIKLSYPKFPVYRTYNLLKAKSKGDFGDIHTQELDNSVEILNNLVDSGKIQVDKLNWADKYKPMATNQIIGNFETIKELKKWLEFWTTRGKINEKSDSDSSDFYYSDADSKDSVKTTDNLLILTGPTGCGKTSGVYAVAADLAIKVIEVNASSKRNGKIMLQDLQEATQSHKVNRTKGSSTDNSQKSQEVIDVDLTKKAKKRGRPKKIKDVAKRKEEAASQSTNSQSENGRTGMSLILIDDADIVFDQDEGFCSAISQLVQYSKRPVILVTTSLACPHLQRFLPNGKIMTMKPLLPRMLGTWLDIMCIADSGICWPGLGAVLLDLFKGDIRKTINCLEFYASSYIEQESRQKEKCSQNCEIFYDETSGTSWTGSDNQEDRNIVCTKTTTLEVNSMLRYFMEMKSNLLFVLFPVDLWNVWWNVPILLNSVFDTKEEVDVSEDIGEKQKTIRQLTELANIANNLSVADYFSQLRPDSRTNISCQPWYTSEFDSSSENENLVCYNESHDLNDDLSKTLVVRSISNAQKCLECEENLYLQPTRMAVQRDRDRVISRHHSVSAHLNLASTLDRRALALDYWSSCRTICRFEKAKTDTNSKRNNRFCHYLKSLKINCKNDVYDKLGESLHVTKQ